MARPAARRRALFLLAVALGAVLVVVDIASLHPALERVADAFWNALFWVLVLVMLALLVWSLFFAESR